MENAFKQLKSLTHIPADIEYLGYLWFDNSNAPDEINGRYDFSTVTRLPFIIEGNLWATDKSHSISIRFIDGNYYIGRVDWQEVEVLEREGWLELVPHIYLSHAFKKHGTLCFKEAWLPRKDLLCDDMETLQPAWIAFTGFEYTEEEMNND